jgi:hypothetical protein
MNAQTPRLSRNTSDIATPRLNNGDVERRPMSAMVTPAPAEQ